MVPLEGESRCGRESRLGVRLRFYSIFFGTVGFLYLSCIYFIYKKSFKRKEERKGRKEGTEYY